MKNDPLNGLRLSFECPMNWEEMKGDAAARFCQKCEKHVHNLEEFTEEEARELVCGAHVCVRYRKDENGRIMTKRTVVAAALIGVAALSSCAPENQTRSSVSDNQARSSTSDNQPQVIEMGVVCPPPPKVQR